MQQGGITFIEIGNKEPDHNIVWVILSTFALIGVGLIVTAALGFTFGFARIWIFNHFPGNKLNGPDFELTTQLHLSDHAKPNTTSTSV